MGLTQEELTKILHVSRTAISKWETGRGYPSIDSLKAISECFSISIDEFLSGKDLLAAEQDKRENRNHTLDIVYGSLDCAALLLLFLSLFAQRGGDVIQEVSLLTHSSSLYIKIPYIALTVVSLLCGLATLALQDRGFALWNSKKRLISLALNILACLLLILTLQPYTAVLVFSFLFIKSILLIKRA